MRHGGLRIRHASMADLAALSCLMARAIDELQLAYLDERQIRASRAVMGIDTQLIADETYFVVETTRGASGCGGWSRRATLFGGDHSTGRDPKLLDPATDAARLRAMYTDPAQARQGIGRLIVQRCEAEALAAGFTRMELAATLSGEPLYRACGYDVLEQFTAGDDVPLLRMGKRLSS